MQKRSNFSNALAFIILSTMINVSIADEQVGSTREPVVEDRDQLFFEAGILRAFRYDDVPSQEMIDRTQAKMFPDHLWNNMFPKMERIYTTTFWNDQLKSNALALRYYTKKFDTFLPIGATGQEPWNDEVDDPFRIVLNRFPFCKRNIASDCFVVPFQTDRFVITVQIENLRYSWFIRDKNQKPSNDAVQCDDYIKQLLPLMFNEYDKIVLVPPTSAYLEVRSNYMAPLYGITRVSKSLLHYKRLYDPKYHNVDGFYGSDYLKQIGITGDRTSWWNNMTVWSNCKYTALSSTWLLGRGKILPDRRPHWFDIPAPSSTPRIPTQRAPKLPSSEEMLVQSWRDSGDKILNGAEMASFEELRNAAKDAKGFRRPRSEVIKLVEEAALKAPTKEDEADMYAALASEHRNASNQEAKMEALQKAFETGAMNWAALTSGHWLAVNYESPLQNGGQDLEKARYWLEKIIERFGTDYYISLCCHNLMARVLIQMGDDEGAYRYHKALSRVNPAKVKVLSRDVEASSLLTAPDKAVIIEKAAESARRAEEHKAETGRYYDIPEQADYSEVLAEVERLRQKAKESESASN